MSFFKRLKEKIFTIKIDEKHKNDKQKPNVLKDKHKEKVSKKITQEENKIILDSLKHKKYMSGLNKSGNFLFRKIRALRARKNKIDEEFFEELEEILIMADITPKLVMEIVYSIKEEVRINNYQSDKQINDTIIKYLYNSYTKGKEIDNELENAKEGLTVYIIVGVNGVGKTTTISKLANFYKNNGKKVLLAAADTFRAGAVEQLNVWASKINVDIVTPYKQGADPSSVVFDAIKKGQEEKYDLLLIDTAGRLENKTNLMNELSKIKRIINQKIFDAPHEILLILDATNGQNALNQANIFNEFLNISGIILTKIDGTSKGGIVLSIKDKLNIEVKMVGLGEQIDDLQEFDINNYIYGLTSQIMTPQELNE